jgi:hypothetical protein
VILIFCLSWLRSFAYLFLHVLHWFSYSSWSRFQLNTTSQNDKLSTQYWNIQMCISDRLLSLLCPNNLLTGRAGNCVDLDWSTLPNAYGCLRWLAFLGRQDNVLGEEVFVVFKQVWEQDRQHVFRPNQPTTLSAIFPCLQRKERKRT